MSIEKENSMLQTLHEGKLSSESQESLFRRLHNLSEAKPFKFDNPYHDEDRYSGYYGSKRYLVYVNTVNEVPPHRYFSTNRGVYRMHQEHFLYNLMDEGRLFFELDRENDFLNAVYFNDLNPDKDLTEKFCELSRENKESLLILKEGANAYLFYKEDIEKLRAADETSKRRQKELEKTKEAGKKLLSKTMSQKYFSGEKIQDEHGNYVEGDHLCFAKNREANATNFWRLTFLRPVYELVPIGSILDLEVETEEDGQKLKENVRIRHGLRNFLNHLNIFNAYWVQSSYSMPKLFDKKVDKQLEVFDKVKDLFIFRIEETSEEGWKRVCDFSIARNEKGRWSMMAQSLPARKVYFAFNAFLSRIDTGSFDEKVFLKFLTNIRRYSAEQLEWLNGVRFEVEMPEESRDNRIHARFDIAVEDVGGEWLLKLVGTDFQRKCMGDDLRKFFRYHHRREDFFTGYENLANIFGDTQKLQNTFIERAQGAKEARERALQKSKDLLAEFLTKHQDRIFPRQDGYVVKGKLKNYLLKIADDEVKVYLYPSGGYCCVNPKTKEGRNYTIFDKIVQFASALLNDSDLREEIQTLR